MEREGEMDGWIDRERWMEREIERKRSREISHTHIY